MKLEPMLEELERAAEQLSVKVKYEALSTSVGTGGLCRVNGEHRVIIDKRASTAERIATLARALGQVFVQLDISGAELSKGARSTIARYSERRAS